MNGPPQSRDVSVLWLTQNRPDEISVGRRLIAEHLRDRGFDVTQTTATPRVALSLIPRAREFDVMVGTTRAGALVGMVLSRIGRTPLVVDEIDPFSQFESQVSWPVAKGVLALENLSFRLADHVLYVYDQEAARVRSRAGTYSQTDFGVEYEMFANPDESVVTDVEAQFAERNVTENVALYVGGLDPLYNIEPMLESVRHLEDWSLVVVGTGSMRSTVETAAGSCDAIHYFGTVPHEELPGFFANADVGLCLVDDDRTLKVLEYMAAGLPVVHLEGRASERFGDLLQYCSTDPSDVAAAVRSANEQTDVTALRERGRQYTWDAISEDYEAAILSALESTQ